MRIAMSVSSMMTMTGQPIQFDGIGVYTSQLRRALLAQDIEIENLYCRPLREGPRTVSKSATGYCAMDPLYTHYLPFNGYKKIEEQVDVVHSTDYRIPKLRQRPLVVTLHDAVMFKHLEWVSPRLRRLKNALLRKTAAQADHVVTISEAVRGDIIDYWGIKEEKISVVHSGIDEAWLRPISLETCADVMNAYQLPPNYLLFVGTLQPRKNVDRIIDAYLQLSAAQRQETKLLIVGKQCPGLTPPDLVERLRRCQEQGDIRWVSWVPFKSLRVMYQQATALLYPSLEEGFGLPILEGFAAGTPVISSDEGAMAEVSGDAAYLVNPRSTEAITAAITAVTNKAVRADLIAKGHSRVREFSWGQCAKAMIAVYSQLL